MVTIHATVKVILLALLLILLNGFRLFSQTCCSGGVPLSGNIGFPGSDRGTFQMELSYDLNYLSTLKNETELLEDDSRQRVTHSFLLKTGYTFTEWMAVDALFSWVVQGRTITYAGEVNELWTSGIGDAVIIAKFLLSRISDNGVEIQLGAGPTIPLGPTDLTDERGILLNADLQPGRGSWGFVTWGYFARELIKRPSMVLSARVTGRFNGTNDQYLGSEQYRFGNAFQFYLGLGDQLIVGNRIVSPSVSFRYRRAFSDQINGLKFYNTGGSWISFLPAIGWNLGQRTIINIIPEIPVYSRVEGVQLTPTFRIQAGVYHRFGQGKIIQIKTDTL